MTDQEKLNFKEKYKNNPVAFCEDILNVKLHSWQKQFLEESFCKDKHVTHFNPHRHMKTFTHKLWLEYTKAMEMDFIIWNKEGIDIYEKGVLVKTIKHDNLKEDK